MNASAPMAVKAFLAEASTRRAASICSRKGSLTTNPKIRNVTTASGTPARASAFSKPVLDRFGSFSIR